MPQGEAACSKGECTHPISQATAWGPAQGLGESLVEWMASVRGQSL